MYGRKGLAYSSFEINSTLKQCLEESPRSAADGIISLQNIFGSRLGELNHLSVRRDASWMISDGLCAFDLTKCGVDLSVTWHHIGVRLTPLQEATKGSDLKQNALTFNRQRN
eukprot:SAG11_NODE_16134_length_556_cov_0.783370_1_plen_111_part_10